MRVYINLIAFLFILQTHAEVIPVSLRVSWENAGYHSLRLPITNLVNVMDFGAKADGITDDKNAIMNAINSLDGHYGVVYLPAGVYLLKSGITLRDSVIIRGAGSNTTFIKIDNEGSGFLINGTNTELYTSIKEGLYKESNKIVIENSSLFSVGDYIEISEENGCWDIYPADWAKNIIGQISKIKDIIGDTLWLEDRLRIDFSLNLHPQIRKINPIKQVRIEYLNIERITSENNACGFNILFNYAAECSIKGIESNKSVGSHCKISASSNIEVTGSYFHDAISYDGSGTRGYGVTIDNHSGLCLISNNIFKHLRHAMMTKNGANGNVFSYNYSIEPYRNGKNEFPCDFTGDISLHGHYSFANLFEGNIVQNIIVDDYWGPSGPYNTFFRNRTEKYGLFVVSDLTEKMNIVGNEITGKLIHGYFAIKGSTHFMYGNNVNGTIIPFEIKQLEDYSYYLDSPPLFWNIPEKWPSIGIANQIEKGSIPAKERFKSGIYTVFCDEDMRDNTLFKNILSIEAYPNPASTFVIINIKTKASMNAKVLITDMSGSGVIQSYADLLVKGDNLIRYDISGFTAGIYFIKVITELESSMTKIIVK